MLVVTADLQVHVCCNISIFSVCMQEGKTPLADAKRTKPRRKDVEMLLKSRGGTIAWWNHRKEGGSDAYMLLLLLLLQFVRSKNRLGRYSASQRGLRVYMHKHINRRHHIRT